MGRYCHRDELVVGMVVAPMLAVAVVPSLVQVLLCLHRCHCYHHLLGPDPSSQNRDAN
jgi:hypothetical protein